MENPKAILLCLHGWGGSKESFTELREALKDAPVEILTPDLPGFGDEPDPPKPWSTDDYADWVLDWISTKVPASAEATVGKEVRSTKFYLLGHSHGGRIALKLVADRKLKPDHLFLCAAAGIRHPRHFKRILGLILAKSGKAFLSIPGMKALQPLGKKFLYRLVRVHDYEQASPVMQQTMIKVSAEDLRPILFKINVPTDIFWGEDDSMTPISDGEFMHRKISSSRLHRFPGVRHRVHRDRAREIAGVILRIMHPSSSTQDQLY